ncbi:MAG: hypothetical protein EP348_01065 [Alphaproteobacteria bacterium]|nr:MAG: hypothetical protein EP348_01065 [Alphaproteobacteria bacterium]
MAKDKKNGKEGAAGSRIGATAIPVMIFIAVGLVFYPPSMLVLLAGMIPSIVALVLQTNRGSSLASMIAFNLAGVIPVVGLLWERGQNFQNAFAILSDVYMWLTMFGGAGLAMFLDWAVPICVYALYDLQAKAVISRLKGQRQKLIEEWGGQFAADIGEYLEPAQRVKARK